MKTRIISLLLCGIVLFSSTGCVVGAAMLVRRGVVHDDWVLHEGVLYRRYLPDGLVLKGNQELLENAGSIVSQNKSIKVFADYKSAVESGLEFTIQPQSESYIEEDNATETPEMDVESEN